MVVMVASRRVAALPARVLMTQSKRMMSYNLQDSSGYSLEGGRYSVSGLTATVFGCGGFLGRYVVNKLARVGTAVVVPHRIDDEDSHRHLRLMGDLGMIVDMPFDARDLDTIATCVEKSDVVINLLGKHQNTMNYTFFGSHVEVASNLAKVCKEVGVPHFVQVSALAADPNSPSEFLRTKAWGEEEVKSYYPNATIVRPSVVFGEEDRFMNLIANWTKIAGMVPLIGSGENKIAPVYVDDVAEGIRTIVFDKDLHGRTYEFAGPEVYTVRETCRYIQKTIWMEDSTVRGVPNLSASLPASMQSLSPHKIAGDIADIAYRGWAEVLPGFPQLLGARGDYASLNSVDWVPHKAYLQLEDIGIEPQSLKVIGPELLRHYQEGGHFSKINIEEDK